MQGTSFAAPQVAGTLALLMARYPLETPRELIGRLLAGVDPIPALQGKCISGGRLNLRNALSPPLWMSSFLPTPGADPWWRLSAGPKRWCVIESSPDLSHWTPVMTNWTSAAGTLEFVDPPGPGGDGQPRFFRGVAQP